MKSIVKVKKKKTVIYDFKAKIHYCPFCEREFSEIRVSHTYIGNHCLRCETLTKQIRELPIIEHIN